MRSFTVIGSGSWGSAFAIHLARLHPDRSIFLWGRNKSHIQAMQIQRKNSLYLPEIIFPPNIQIIDQLDFLSVSAGFAIQDNIFIIAVPSGAFCNALKMIKPYFSPDTPLFWITKGLDPETHDFLHFSAQQILGSRLLYNIISGPSFAREVALGLPAAVTLAGADKNYSHWFHAENFRVYFTDDIIGVQLGGAVKNVLAVAVGIAEGLSCGANAQAALITRGLAEMMRLGAACGARSETLMGLSGAGDLILTCTSNQSRNRRFGIALTNFSTLEKARDSIGQVVEGIQTTQEIYRLSQKYTIDMPIILQIYKVLYENLPPAQALKNLLTREPKTEYL